MLDMNKIGEISLGIDEHLKKLESFIGVLQDIKISLDYLKNHAEASYLHQLHDLKQEVGYLTEQLRKRGLPHADKYERELTELRQLVHTENWPTAVDPEKICGDSEELVIQRAEGILDLFVAEHLKGKRFLDFGCGQGHTVPEALKREASVAIGYDVNLSKCPFDKKHFVDNFDQVKALAPYDIVLMYDVLDHIVQVDPIEALRQARYVLKPGGRVYVKNHPWSSRHGGHLYEQHNKAYLHLILDEIELTRLGNWHSTETNVKVVTPLETYRHWFKEAGFRVVNEFPTIWKVEDFFLRPSPVRDRLEKHWTNPDTITDHLEIEFVEYILEAAEPSLHSAVLF